MKCPNATELDDDGDEAISSGTPPKIGDEPIHSKYVMLSALESSATLSLMQYCPEAYLELEERASSELF